MTYIQITTVPRLPLERRLPGNSGRRKRGKDKIELDYGFVITRDIYKEEEINGKRIFMIPAWAFVLFKDEFLI